MRPRSVTDVPIRRPTDMGASDHDASPRRGLPAIDGFPGTWRSRQFRGSGAGTFAGDERAERTPVDEDHFGLGGGV
jgi:hypothetical protein